MNYFIEIIKPYNKERCYGFSIHSKKTNWSLFVSLDFTIRSLKYPKPFFKYYKCPSYGPQLTLGKLKLQFTTWEY